MRRASRSWTLSLVLGLAQMSGVACAPVPRPTVLGDVDRASQAPAADDAKTFAPQAYLYAEKLRADAEKAEKAGDRTGAQILAEHALAAYAHASALSRLAKATERRERADTRVAATTEQATKLDENQRRVAAEADDIEGRLRVARDALPLTPSEPASADRERARFTAARSLAVEARLLCVATQMLVPDTKELTQAFDALRELDAELAKKPARAPIDTAVKLRSACLSELTRARRPATLRAPEEGAPDALLDELSRAGSEPRRDERGVIVVLRDLFKSKAMTAPATDALTRLGQVARAHASFPVLVVVHARRGTTPADAAQQGDAIGKQLAASGAARVKVELAGDALPVAAPQQKDAVQRNDRVEIVFIAPSH